MFNMPMLLQRGYFLVSMLPQTVDLLLDLFCTRNNQGRELCWHDFMKYTFNIVPCQDTWEPICFKLGMMLNMTKHYNLIAVWKTLIFTQGQRVVGKVRTCAVVVLWNWMMQLKCSWRSLVEYPREITVMKSRKYGEYGSFDHLLFLFICLFIFLLPALLSGGNS